MAADTTARFTATLLDSEQVKATAVSHLYIDSAQTVAAVTTALQAWQTALDAVTGAQIIQSSAAIQPGLVGGLKGAAVAGSEAWEVGVFGFSQAGNPFHYGEAVPALLESLVTNGEINESAGAVTALTGLLTGAVLGGHYTGLSRDALTSLAYSFRAIRKHRRALRSKSARTP